MNDEAIHIPARKKQQTGAQMVVKVTPEAYNTLVEIYNESTLSLKQIASLLIVKAAERVVYDKYLTSVLRGESTAQEIVVEGTGDGCSEARTMEKAPSEKERLKAAELLGKRYALFTDKVDMDTDMDLNITIDYGEADTG